MDCENIIQQQQQTEILNLIKTTAVLIDFIDHFRRCVVSVASVVAVASSSIIKTLETVWDFFYKKKTKEEASAELSLANPHLNTVLGRTKR